MDVSSRDNLDLGEIKRKNNLRKLQPVDNRSSVYNEGCFEPFQGGLKS